MTWPWPTNLRSKRQSCTIVLNIDMKGRVVGMLSSQTHTQTHTQPSNCSTRPLNWSMCRDNINTYLHETLSTELCGCTLYTCLLCSVSVSQHQQLLTWVGVAQLVSVAKILRFFDFSRWRWLPSWIVEFTKFHWLTMAGFPRRITSPNFVKIGRSIADMLQFFVFSRWPPPPSWIFEIANFYWLFGWRGLRRISLPNFVKIGQSVAKILWPRFFKMAAAAILDCRIYKILLAVGVWRADMHHCTKFRQNRSFRCRDIAFFRIFKLAAADILDFWSHEILLAVVVERV